MGFVSLKAAKKKKFKKYTVSLIFRSGLLDQLKKKNSSNASLDIDEFLREKFTKTYALNHSLLLLVIESIQLCTPAEFYPHEPRCGRKTYNLLSLKLTASAVPKRFYKNGNGNLYFEPFVTALKPFMKISVEKFFPRYATC